MNAHECCWIRIGAALLEGEGQMSIGSGHPKMALAEAKALYTRWAPMVLRFCKLFLGDDSLAEQAAIEILVRFFKSGHRAEENGVPVGLLSLAFRVASQSFSANRESLEPLHAAVLDLDPTRRAVFILHGAMSVQLPWIAAILGLSLAQITGLWAKALLQIRDRLPEDFFKEQHR